jgi:hypothetical protein
MKPYNHIVDRNIVEWTSFGRFHNEPPRKTLIKDISDSHLMRIIEWIKHNRSVYTEEILNLMIQEVKFRSNNYIFVPESY